MDSLEKMAMKKKEKREKKLRRQEKTAAHIAGGILRVQVLISRRLQRFERRLSVKQKKTGFFIFCILGSTYLCYMLGNALFFERPPDYHDFLPDKEMTIPPQDSGGYLNLPLKQFNHHKNHGL